MNGIKNHKIVALDSNIFIYHFEDKKEFVPYTKIIFEKLFNGELELVTSIVSVIETLSYPSPKHVINGIEEGFRALPHTTIFNVDHEIALLAASIRRTYGFRLPDATQLATALHGKAKIFITNDDRLKKFKELKVILISEV